MPARAGIQLFFHLGPGSPLSRGRAGISNQPRERRDRIGDCGLAHGIAPDLAVILPEAGHPVAAPRRRDEHAADRIAVGRGLGSGDAGDRGREVGLRVRERALRHRARDLLTDGAFPETLARIAANKTGVGVFGLSFYENNADKLKVATMKGVKPSVETVAEGKYPG